MGRRVPQILLISSFPPTHCGIGAYASQEAISLRRHNAIVHTLCLSADGNGTYRVNLASITSICRLLVVLSFVPLDRARIHYVDNFLLLGPPGWRGVVIQILQCLLWTNLAVRSRLEVVVHEFSPVAAFGDRGRWSRKHLFTCAKAIEFHTAIERMRFEKSLPRTTAKNLVVSHNRHFVRAFEGSQVQARDALGLPRDEKIFLCIGFIQPHKGFDLAVRAFAEAQPVASALYIVGSVRHDTPANLAYRDALVSEAERVDKVHVIDRFVDDVAFDTWICAADMVVLPYAEIWTSGVLARAMLFNRPVAMRDHATLREQVVDYPAAIFPGERQLGAIMKNTLPAEDRTTTSAPSEAQRRRVLVVAPLYGPMHSGGAERVIAKFADLLSETCDVEIWSTRSSQLEGRNNDVTDAPSREGFVVKRFDTNTRVEFLFRMAHRRVAQARRGTLWQWLWARTSISGLGMRKALRKEQSRFDVIMLPHYFYGSTHRLATVAPAKTIVHPFLHDEPALRTRVIGRLFGAPALVTLNSDAERDVASLQSGLPVFRSETIGNVVPAPAVEFDTSLPPQSLPQATRYVLFMGRMIEEKNVGLLHNWFNEAGSALPADLKLVMVGQGPLENAWRDDPRIIQLPHVSEGEKWRLMQHCVALVMPSLLESFSLVTLEAWLAGRPVIVHADCKATTLHIARSGGGTAARTSEQFAQAVTAFLDNPAEAHRKAQRGREYVLAHFSENAVKLHLEHAVEIVARAPHAVDKPLPAATRPSRGNPSFERAYAARRWGNTKPAASSGRRH